MWTMQHVRELVDAELRRSIIAAAWLGFGDPLFLELDRMPESAGGNVNGERARCQLDTNFATWSVTGPIHLHQERDAGDRLEDACRLLLGAVVQHTDVADDGRLTLQFDWGRTLIVEPWPVEEGQADAWCITLRDGRILAVSNAGQVAVVDRDLPIPEWFTHE